jgi:hypothetical protein
VTDITSNVAYQYHAFGKATEGAYNKLRDDVDRKIKEEVSIPQLKEYLYTEVEAPYMRAFHNWAPITAVRNNKGRWKSDSYLLGMSFEQQVKDHGLNYEVVPANKNRGECLKVEALPNGYKSAKSVLLRAHEEGIEITGKGKTALNKESIAARAKARAPVALVADPLEDALRLAAKLTNLIIKNPTIRGTKGMDAAITVLNEQYERSPF